MRQAKNPWNPGFLNLRILAMGLILIAQTPFVYSESVPRGFESAPRKSILTDNHDFDRNDLVAEDFQAGRSISGFSLLNPNRFSMQQSYSVNFASGSLGSSSAGIYMNTLNYKLADPLTLSADIGFHSPLYSSAPRGMGPKGFQDPTQGSSIIFPRLGLEYKPTKNTTFSLQLFNGQDAVKAYGFSDPFLNHRSR